MKKVLFISLVLISCIILIQARPCNGAENPDFVFVRAVTDQTGPVFITRGDKKYPLLEKIETPDTKTIEITRLLDTGISKTSLKIGQYAKNFMHYRIAGGGSGGTAEIYLEPLYIYAKKGGNRPQQGFYLRENGREIDKTFTYYIEMPPDPVQFETIFAHENGHLIDYYLGDVKFKKQPARFVHTAPAVTDYATAYIEGWGIHFETMMADLTPSARARSLYTFDGAKDNAYFLYSQDLMNLAHKSKRYSWVKANLFAFQRFYKPCPGETAETSIKNFVYNWMNSDFDSGAIKNAQQLMSSEGVAASFFYRLVNDPAIQKRYRAKEFYAPFLKEGAGPADPSELFTPLENAYLKIFYAKNALSDNYSKNKIESAGPLLLDFAAQYMKSFPEDSTDVLIHFYMTTYFTTVLKDAATLYRDLDTGAHFTLCDPELSKTRIQEALKKIQNVFKESGATKEISTQYLGEPLWIQNDKFDIGEKDSPMTLSLNLNSAEKFELVTIPGMRGELADKFLALREKSVFFKSIDEIGETKVFVPAMIDELKRMQAVYENRK